MDKRALLLLLFLSISAIFVFQNRKQEKDKTPPILQESPKEQTSLTQTPEVIATNLDTPWAIAFLPDGSFLVTERKGKIWRVNSSGTRDLNHIADISNVREIGEGGLLGITVHPDFTSNRYVYLYYTYQSEGDNTFNRVVRMEYKESELQNEKVILDAIPGSVNHNGGRIKFGPDGLLYIGTGDAGEPSLAQDTNSLAGKILRITAEGTVPKDNPFGNPVYSYGHRNVQGLAWDNAGNLWATEHGRSGALSGFDELNLIEKGGNYGWPEIQGDETRQGMISPKQHSGANTTWAPSSAVFAGSSLYFAGLRGQTLYEAVIENENVTELKEHLKQQYGRLREVVLGPDGLLYFTTSNRDGRASPEKDDDRIIRLNVSDLEK
jgi:glucose/arabinose dehydrogenase